MVLKTYLPNYREFYEKRQFTSGLKAARPMIDVAGELVPFGNDLIFFSRRTIQTSLLHVEICEDLWVPIPPSSYAALAGATVLVNQSASNVTIGKAEYRRLLCGSQSAVRLGLCLCRCGFRGIDDGSRLGWTGSDLRERRYPRRDASALPITRNTPSPISIWSVCARIVCG